MRSTGWPRPSVTPSPRQTSLRTSLAASRPIRDSRHRGGWEMVGVSFMGCHYRAAPGWLPAVEPHKRTPVSGGIGWAFHEGCVNRGRRAVGGRAAGSRARIGRDPRVGARCRDKRGGHAPAPRPLSGAAGRPAGHSGAGAGRRGGGPGPRRRALLGGRPGGRHRGRGRPGRALHRPRTWRDAAPRRAGLARRRGLRRGVHHRPRRPVHPGRAEARRAAAGARRGRGSGHRGHPAGPGVRAPR